MVLLGKFCCKVAIARMTEHGLVFRTDAVSCTPMWIPTFQPSDGRESGVLACVGWRCNRVDLCLQRMTSKSISLSDARLRDA